MKTTPIYGFPYPENPDHTRLWEYWQGLATAVENTLTNAAPFRSHAQILSVTISAASWATKAFTWPAGRFTQIPVLLLTSTEATVIAAQWSGLTLGGGNIMVRQYQDQAGSATLSVYALGWQATSASGPGLFVQPPPSPPPVTFADGPPEPILVTATCHTAGCGNEGIPLTLWAASLTDPIQCGACFQPITDIVEAEMPG
jgi:hypothetical protein